MNTRKLLVVVLVLFTVCCLVFTACTSEKSAEPAQGSKETGPKRLTYSRGSDVITFDLFNTAFISPMIVSRCIQDTLVYQNNEGEFSPYLATSWETNKDATQWTFHLRKDAKFSDGTPFTARDVKASYEYPVKNAVASSGIFSSLKSVDVIDDYTCVFNYSSPCGTLLADLWNYPVTSAANIEAGSDVLASKPIGTGPYMLSEWNPGKNVVMVRNPHWWGEPTYYDEIEFVLIAETATRAAAVQTGDLDICEGVSAELKSTMQGDPNLYMFDVILCDNIFLAFNCEDPPFNDVKVRQAVSYALNRDAFVSLYGGGTTAKCLLPSTCLGHNENLSLPYDPEKAKKLLAESSYDGSTASLIVNFGTISKAKEICELAQNMLSAIGLKIEILSFDSAGFVAARSAGDFGMQLNTAAHVGYEPNTFLQRFVTDLTNLRYKNDEVLALIEEGRGGSTIEARQATYEKLMTLLNEEMPYAPFFEYSTTYAVSKRVSSDGLEQVLRNDRIPYLRNCKGVD